MRCITVIRYLNTATLSKRITIYIGRFARAGTETHYFAARAGKFCEITKRRERRNVDELIRGARGARYGWETRSVIRILPLGRARMMYTAAAAAVSARSRGGRDRCPRPGRVDVDVGPSRGRYCNHSPGRRVAPVFNQPRTPRVPSDRKRNIRPPPAINRAMAV